MSVLDVSELDHLSKPKRLQCGIKVLLETMSDEDAVALKRELEKPKEVRPHTAIRTWLQNAGFDIGVDAVQRHRRGDCSCHR